jgi:ATP-binding cassette, subfamily B, bacterial CvaB/MchF/RaxB
VRPIRGAIELRNVSFRYAETEPLILHEVNLCVDPGQFVTIMGPSGCGKTTLVKIMLGLLEPTAGEVLIDGSPLCQIGRRVYREQIGAVMQEDQLLSGSIADNICFFETSFDPRRMIECAQIAGIHDDIMTMPMSYNSLIGDMGSSLSSGQKQRVLLARALYRQPKILFLDEGTAHLDTEKEKETNANLRYLNMTRVSIAHRPEITHGADMIVHLSAPAGRLQVGVTGLAQARAPARDAGPGGFASQGTRSVDTPLGNDDCSGTGQQGNYSKDARTHDCSKDDESDSLKHDRASKETKSDDRLLHKSDVCQPQIRDSKPSDDRAKDDAYRSPGETLARFIFSNW